MSETFDKSDKSAALRPETQKERWFKYGLNVLLVSLIVVVLAVLLIATVQSKKVNVRLDTTTAGLYSLKPQTLNIIKNNSQDIRIVSLYTRAKDAKAYEQQGRQEDELDEVTPVADLLDEYQRKGNKITVEVIDPVAQATRVDQLVEEVTQRYGGEIQKYKQITLDYPKVIEQITQLSSAEVEKVKALPVADVKDPDLADTLNLTWVTIQGFPRFLDRTKESVDRRLQQKIPDYKGAVDAIDQGMGMLSQMAGQILGSFDKQKEDQKVPEAIRKYMVDSRPAYQQVKDLSDGLEKRIKELGELKLDELKQSLRQQDTILVMGESEMRVITKDKVWQEPEAARNVDPDVTPQPRFAGEQQVTSAILAVTRKERPKVAFVRAGGAPLTTEGNPFQRGGPFSDIAQRLRDYNFEVVEKDLTGMWAMQSRMQRSPFPQPEEPTDEQIKDAVWVVVGLPGGQSPMGGPPPTIGVKVAEHVKNGGSVLILGEPRGEDFAEALGDYGIKLRTDAAAVHEPVGGVSRSADMVEQAQRNPFIFVIQNYGDHFLTNPINSLDGVVLPMLLVETQAKPGIKSSKLLPVPQVLKVWGETAMDQALQDGKVEKNPGDVEPPLWSGAAAEREDGKGRVVVIGSVQFAMNHIVNLPHEEYLPRYVVRFPGNAELFCNSVLWLAKMEPMIAISPAAMQQPRVKQISNGALNVWRVLLFAGLPLAVLASGALVYNARRD